MKTTRILSLLFSISQFILVLKLIEYVRGEETELSDKQRAPRHFFVAPGIQKRKKYKPWLSSTSTTEDSTSTLDTLTNSSEIGAYVFQKKIPEYNETNYKSLLKSNSTMLKTNDSITFNVKKIGILEKQEKNGSSTSSTASASTTTSSVNENMARLCPACANGECNGNVQGSSFPIIPIIVAIVAAVIWFFIFLWIVIGSRKKDSTSEGYGYGSSSYGAPLPSITYNNNMAKSINDFLGSEEIGKMTKFVLHAVEKFSN